MSTKKSLLTGIFRKKNHLSEEELFLIAHKKADKIVERAVSQANVLLEESDLISEALKREFDKSLKDAIAKNATKLDAQLDHMVNETFSEFKKLLFSELEKTQSLIQQKLDEEYARIDQEVTQYGIERKQDIDNNIEQEVKKTVQKVLANILPPTDQQRLVLQAIQRAKKDGFFG